MLPARTRAPCTARSHLATPQSGNGLPERSTETAVAVLPRPDDVFVGRDELIATLAATRPGGRAWILDTFGLFGSGKTRFLKQLLTELPARRPTLAFEIVLSQADQPRDTATGRDLANAYARFCDLVEQLVDDFVKQEEKERSSKEAKRAMEPVTHALTAARNAANPMQTNVRVVNLFSRFEHFEAGATKAEFGDAFVERDIKAQQSRLAETFADALAPALRGRNALVTIDGFEWVAEAPLGSWLLDLVERSTDTVAAIARTPTAAAPMTSDAEVVTRALPPLAREEIAEFLERCLGTPQIDDRLLDVVATFTNGHAQAVGLVGELLQLVEPAERDANAVRQRLQALPDDLAEKHGNLVGAILECDGRELAEVVHGCSILRRFDAALLEAVVGLEEGGGARAVEDLNRYSFVSAVPDPRGGFFALHDFIRRELERRLMSADPEGGRKRHRVAAEHIARWLADYEESEFPEGRNGYGAWYRYERPEWRAARQEWLYHEARAAEGPGTKRERERARLRFARLFFDAFWWWGCYRDFPAVRELLANWNETQSDVAWTEHLATFLESYPTGYEKDGGPARWEQVEHSLRLVRAACGLAGGHDDDDEEQLHVHGVMENFNAHAARYPRDAENGYGDARAHYDEAVRVFTELEDDWDLAWTLFERAELHLEHGGAAAHDDWRHAVEVLPTLGDDELTANLYRLAADSRWARAPHEAFALHGRAILHAYLFQGRYQGTRYRPDAYTLDFYAEQLERALGRLIEHGRGGGDVSSAVAELLGPLPVDGAVDAEEVARLCAEDGRAELALLFPEPPSVADLERDESAFLERWEENVAVAGEPDPAVTADAW